MTYQLKNVNEKKAGQNGKSETIPLYSFRPSHYENEVFMFKRGTTPESLDFARN